mgnify:CR=1 FL=1
MSVVPNNECSMINTGYVRPEVSNGQHQLTLQGESVLTNGRYVNEILIILSNCINRPDCICPFREKFTPQTS